MIVRGKLSQSRLQAIGFFADKLLTKQLNRHIIVNVVFRKNLSYLGLTYVDDYNSSGKLREFTLEIYRDQIEEEILKTLAHELVHVRQYAVGDLNEEATLWQGRLMEVNLAYENQPWEIEADELADILYEEYIHHERQRIRKNQSRNR
jgi:predicted SprT family Zn-dependent metalloprotease